MANSLEYSKWYTYAEAAKTIGVSIEWAERWLGAALREGTISNGNGKDKPVLISGADIKKVCMKRWQQLETELQWRAFDRVRARERGEPIEED